VDPEANRPAIQLSHLKERNTRTDVAEQRSWVRDPEPEQVLIDPLPQGSDHWQQLQVDRI
jgi:hypothetical protein